MVKGFDQKKHVGKREIISDILHYTTAATQIKIRFKYKIQQGLSLQLSDCYFVC